MNGQTDLLNGWIKTKLLQHIIN